MSNDTKASGGVGEGIPALISKKWLCSRFGLFSGSTPAYQQLYKKVLTPEVLEAAGLEIENVRKISVRTFDAVTSDKIKRALSLSAFLLVSVFGFAQTANVPASPGAGTFAVKDSIIGVALVMETHTYYTEASCDQAFCAVLHQKVKKTEKITVVVDAYQVTEGIVVVDGFGAQKPKVTNVRYHRLDDCSRIPQNEIFLFKHQ